MRRRSFLRSVAAIGITAIASQFARAQSSDLRAIYKIVDGRRVQCRMYELKVGDHFEFDEDGKTNCGKATSRPRRQEDGHWGILAEWSIKEG